jgi:hypothetical protein
MKQGIVAMVVAAALLASSVVVATARTHVLRADSTISQDAFVALGPVRYLVGGEIHSPQNFCKYDRTIRVTAHYPDGNRRLVGIDHTAIARGPYPGAFTAAWAITANLAGVDRLKAKLRGKTFSGRSRVHRHPRRFKVVCGRAAVVFAAPRSAHGMESG